jgi:GT2 family glycosyltransferase/glycosyltransferase involved in cell wall biosynthesis
MSDLSHLTVAVVVINYNGLRHLEACFNSLLKQTYPAHLVELILVDNNSSDGSQAFVSSHFPTVRIIQNASNAGFAPAVNQAARATNARYVALINNDAAAEAGWLAALVDEIKAYRDDGVICVGALMVDWEGERIDFINSGINYYGHGNQPFHQLPVEAVADQPHELLFACGGAMLVDRAAFLDIGGFDASYFAYFEDVDFGWRTWLYGYKVRFTPHAVVRHRHHATANTMHGHQVRKLLERNALVTIIKNYDDQNLQRILPAALLLILKRSLLDAGTTFDRHEFDLRQRDSSSFEPTMAVPKIMLSYIAALSDVIDDWPRLWAQRASIQARRKRLDTAILPLFQQPFAVIDLDLSLHLFQETMTETFNLRSLFEPGRTTNVLIISTDPLHDRLAGPGIRAVEMARYLSASCHVVLAAPEQADVSLPDVRCIAFRREDNTLVQHLANGAEVVIVQGFTLSKYPALRESERIIVVDLYDPFHLENLELIERRDLAPEQASKVMEHSVAVLNEQLLAGDFFICASERQRDLWLGALGVVGRLSPEAYRRDPTLRSLIDVVPFGLQPDQPAQTQNVLKGVVPGIEPDDLVLLWGGGIWEWLDPLTVIRAMAPLSQSHPDIKLFFLGQHHPNPAEVGPMLMYQRALDLAAEQGLLNRTVFFNDCWVAYDQRHNYLLEADVGISAHTEHIETRFAFRTRLLDYMWAGLPMIVSAGDTLADTVTAWNLGRVVAVGNVDAWTAAIIELAAQRRSSSEPTGQFAAAQKHFAWSNTLKPLIDFCANPRYAADKRAVAQLNTPAPGQPSPRYRMDELDRVVAEKNAHITNLEDMIQRLENGRVLRFLSALRRWTGR